jgi:hypothetical protein
MISLLIVVMSGVAEMIVSPLQLCLKPSLATSQWQNDGGLKRIAVDFLSHLMMLHQLQVI